MTGNAKHVNSLQILKPIYECVASILYWDDRVTVTELSRL